MLLSSLVSNFSITPLYNLSHTRIIHNWLVPIKTKVGSQSKEWVSPSNFSVMRCPLLIEKGNFGNHLKRCGVIKNTVKPKLVLGVRIKSLTEFFRTLSI